MGFPYLRNPCLRNPCFRNSHLRNPCFRNSHLRNFSRIQAPLNQTPLRLPPNFGANACGACIHTQANPRKYSWLIIYVLISCQGVLNLLAVAILIPEGPLGSGDAGDDSRDSRDPFCKKTSLIAQWFTPKNTNQFP